MNYRPTIWRISGKGVSWAMVDDIFSLHRARLAREKGTIRKDWGGKLSVALVYPNHYGLGMSNLGFQTVYGLLNRRPDVVAERVFLPEGREALYYLQKGQPLLSCESQRPLGQFDLVAFSLSFENDYLNVLKILDLGRIPLFSEARNESFPMVMAGGVTTFLNPEPLAAFVDFFLLGEAEAILDRFVDLFIETRAEVLNRMDCLKVLARQMASIYVPSLYHIEYGADGTIRSFAPGEAGVPEKIEVACHRTYGTSAEEIPTSPIQTPDATFSDMVLLEVGRGCGRSCRFCAAGYAYRPPRFGRGPELVKAAEKALQLTDRLGLVGAAISDVPDIENLVAFIVDHGGTFSVSSLRADSLSTGLLDLLTQTGQRSLALAPEAGSERLRRVINKHLTMDQITDAVRMIAETGHFSLRFYFLIGLPTETTDDVLEILELVKRLKHQMVKASASRGKIGRIKLSVNCFVPKPSTPFQWFPLEQVASLKDKQRRLRKAVEKEGGIRVNFDVPKWAYIQALLSLGDRRVGPMLLKAHQLDGDWTKALRASEVNPDFFVYRPKGEEETLPWDFIDHGVSKDHLLREYELALREEASQTCQVGNCYRCGVCKKGPGGEGGGTNGPS
jgi:radical SAM superfamily enzyme YgiQ (UPF0313 family)